LPDKEANICKGGLIVVKEEKVATSHVATVFLDELKDLTHGYIILCDGKKTPEGSDFLCNFREYSTEFTPDPSVNTYYTVNPRHELNTDSSGTIMGQGRKDQIREVIAFYADIEAGDGGHKKESFYKTKEEALKAIKSFILKPTYIIDSGHGYHCLWLFKSAYVLGEDVELEYYEAMNSGIQKTLHADTTSDVTRLLRLPGTYNVKDPYNPVPCEIVEDSKLSYSLEDFEGYITPVYKINTSETDLNLNLEVTRINRRKLSTRINKIISEGIDQQNPENTDRSSLIQTVVSAMVAKEYTDNEIYTVLTDRTFKISEKILEQKGDKARKRYVALSIGKAKAYINAEKIETATMNAEMEKKLVVLGYTGDHKVIFWNKGTIQKFELRRLCKDDLCLLTGSDVMSEETATELKRYIRQQCNAKGLIYDSNKIGNGIWDLNDAFVIVSGEDVIKIEDPQIDRVAEPVICSKIVEFGESWLNVELFTEVYQEASLEEVYNGLKNYTDKWSWKEPAMSDYIASFVMLAPFQKAMKWRPWLYLHARPGSGKTLFFSEVLERLYGPLVKRLDNATGYAAAQNLSGTGAIALFDNFEPNRISKKLLETFQPASRGIATVTRGTVSDNPRIMKIFHMLWFNSAIPAIDSNASDTRTVIFKLDPMSQHLEPMGESYAETFRAKLVAAMLKNWQQIEEKASSYIKASSERKTENVAYAMAIQELVTGNVVELPQFIEEREMIDGSRDLLDAIMRARVIPESSSQQTGSNKRPIYDCLLKGESVESYGVKLINSRDGKKYIAIHPQTAKRNLLYDIPEYRDLSHNSIKEVLLNLEGAERKKERINIGSKWAVLLPYSYLEEYSDEFNTLTMKDFPVNKIRSSRN